MEKKKEGKLKKKNQYSYFHNIVSVTFTKAKLGNIFKVYSHRGNNGNTTPNCRFFFFE